MTVVSLAVCAAVALTGACGRAGTPAATVTPPPATGGFDYQLGGGYDPYPGTAIVARDRTEAPVAGLYNICYVNAFQTQEADLAGVWDRRRDLLLAVDDTTPPPVGVRPADSAAVQGYWVIDGAWEEVLLDTGTAQRRRDLLDVMRPWLAGCAAAGYQAVEADNLDSYQRSGGRLSVGDNLAYATMLAVESHRLGLAFGRKNDAGITAEQDGRVGFDFAVVEECGRYDECEDVVAVHGDLALLVEYTTGGLLAACAAGGRAVQRDVPVQPRGVGGHVRRTCP